MYFILLYFKTSTWTKEVTKLCVNSEGGGEGQGHPAAPQELVDTQGEKSSETLERAIVC